MYRCNVNKASSRAVFEKNRQTIKTDKFVSSYYTYAPDITLIRIMLHAPNVLQLDTGGGGGGGAFIFTHRIYA